MSLECQSDILHCKYICWMNGMVCQNVNNKTARCINKKPHNSSSLLQFYLTREDRRWPSKSDCFTVPVMTGYHCHTIKVPVNWNIKTNFASLTHNLVPTTFSLHVLLKAYTGWGRKNSPIWEEHSFGWGARRRTAVYVPFSVYTMAWSGEHRAFIVEEFIKMSGRR
jgi:hypothetical protein